MPPGTIQTTLDRLVKRENGCHEWPGCLQSEGYGMVTLHRKRHYVHRLVYEYHRGPIPEGLELDHLCRNRRCANPDHLEPVTHQVNCHRGTSPSARNATVTHCPRGHPYDAKNTYIRAGGGRMCRKCKYIRKHAARTAKRESRANLTGL
jgi:hypothetical protein